MYTYLQMVHVLNLIVFTVTIGSQLMAFTHKIAKSVQATMDLYSLVQLRTDETSEAQGMLQPSPPGGDLVLKNVIFAYPTRIDEPLLRGLTMSVREGKSEHRVVAGRQSLHYYSVCASPRRARSPLVGSNCAVQMSTIFGSTLRLSANSRICSMEASGRTLCTERYRYRTWMSSVQHTQPTELYTAKICRSEVSTALVTAEKYRPETETEFVTADICECETQFETTSVCKFHPKQVRHDWSLSIFPPRKLPPSRQNALGRSHLLFQNLMSSSWYLTQRFLYLHPKSA